MLMTQIQMAWRMLLETLCAQIHFTIRRQMNSRMATCHPPHHLMASTPMGRHLHHLTEKAVLPISLTICEASTLHRKMTWKTMV